jgi:hypothetical protein
MRRGLPLDDLFKRWIYVILRGFSVWILSNLLLGGLLVWHRVVVPHAVRKRMAVHQNAARSIDDFRGVVWG